MRGDEDMLRRPPGMPPGGLGRGLEPGMRGLEPGMQGRGMGSGRGRGGQFGPGGRGGRGRGGEYPGGGRGGEFGPPPDGYRTDGPPGALDGRCVLCVVVVAFGGGAGDGLGSARHFLRLRLRKMVRNQFASPLANWQRRNHTGGKSAICDVPPLHPS